MRLSIRTSSLALAVLLTAVPASAQVVHSMQIGGGLFFPRGIDARDPDDVLVRNFFGEQIQTLPAGFTDALAFEVKDFRGGRVFGEWNIGLGPRVEVGVGLGYYRKTVPTVMRDVTDGDFEIEQEMHLRITPVTALVRFLPFGRPGDVQPYVGAGVSMLNFRYSEIGQFVDTNNADIFSSSETVTGSAPGGVLLGGVRFPLGGDIYGLAVEGRYQFGKGNIPTSSPLPADKVDLSGGELNFSFLVRF